MNYSFIKKTKISLDSLANYLKNKDKHIYCIIKNQTLIVNIGEKDIMLEDEYNIYWVRYFGFDYEAFFEIKEREDNETEVFIVYKPKFLTHIFPLITLTAALFIAYKGASWLWYIVVLVNMYYIIKNMLFDSQAKLDFINHIESLIEDIK